VVENPVFFVRYDIVSRCKLLFTRFYRVTKLRHTVLETFKQQLMIHFEAGLMCFLKIIPKYVGDTSFIYIYIYI